MKNFWKNRKVFVTGSTGLLGGWLVKNLLQADAEVICLVRDWVPNSELKKQGMASRAIVVAGDLSDQLRLEAILGEYEVQTVIHLAAQTIVGTANRNPISTWESNVRGTWNLLEACKRTNTISEIVVASSDKAYGDQKELPYNENAPLRGLNPYDCSKSCVDLISQSYAHTFKLPITITRCGNLYGGGDLNWNRIVPGTIRGVFNGESPVIRSTGKLVRDYFFVEDAVDAYMNLVEKMSENPELSGEAFNFSSEIRMNVIELVEKITLTMGRGKIKPIILNNASNEIENQYLSCEKARKLLDWSPKYGLDEGMKKTIQWYTELLEAK